jgi:hypothetical protein
MNQSGDLGRMRSEISFVSGLDRANQPGIARQLSLYAQRFYAPFGTICSGALLNVRLSQCSSGKSARFPVVWSRRLLLGDKSRNTADHTCPPIRQRRKLGAARIRARMRTGSKAGEPMARNFGMPQQIRREYRGSLWPLLVIGFILAGAIDIAAHLQHW